MSKIDQILSYVKNLNEKYNLIVANAKKTEELPFMDPFNPNGIIMVSEEEEGVWKSKKLEIQAIIDALSLDGQDNKIREVTLGTITDAHDLNYLLDNKGITVSENEIIILTALTTIDATLIQKQYIWKKGKGDYNPIGSSDINTKLLELQPKFINEIVSDELTNSPQAIVYDFGVVTDPILNVLNSANPARDYTDEEKIYYVRFIKDDVKLLYNFIGVNGVYGDSALQMVESDLVLVYSSSNVNSTDLLDLKLDKGGYSGNAQDLKNEIDNLETSKAPTTYVDAQDAQVLSDANAYTDAGLAGKLDASAYNDRYKGKYTSLANLQSAHPTANSGDYAQVDEGGSFPVVNYNWDTEEGWVVGSTGGSGATTTDELPEGSTNLYHSAARVLATLLTGISFATGGAIVSTDSVLVAFGKLQKQLSDLITTVSDKENSENKTDDIETNKTSSVKFSSTKAVVDWVKSYFVTNLPAKSTALVDGDLMVIGDSEDSSKTKTRTFAQVKTTLGDTFAKKYGTRTVLSGTVIDWSTDTDVYTKTLTSATVLTDTNLPLGTNTRTIVLSIDGAFPLTLPAYYKHKGGTYNTAKTNQIVLQCINGNIGSERVNYMINPDL